MMLEPIIYSVFSSDSSNAQEISFSARVSSDEAGDLILVLSLWPHRYFFKIIAFTASSS